MKFDITKETTNPLYTLFFSESQLDVNTEKSKWRNSLSSNSFCFINPEVKYKERAEIVRKKLCDVFGIEDEKLFEEKFKMAIAGDGQEVKRIAVVHSSSLAALLMFYSISDNKILYCTLDGEEYKFSNSFFEVKTNVKGSHFSNMDVVLVGKDSSDKKVIFFLECKFSEYLNTGMCNDISIDAYKEKYIDLGLLYTESRIQGLRFVEDKGKDNVDCLQIKSDTPQYCHGIKQMISHYIGVTNFASEGINALDEKQNKSCFYTDLPDSLNDGASIILGEVLFDFTESIDKKEKGRDNKLTSYSKIYSELARILQDHSKKIKVLPEILTYQTLMKNFELDPNVKAFYQL